VHLLPLKPCIFIQGSFNHGKGKKGRIFLYTAALPDNTPPRHNDTQGAVNYRRAKGSASGRRRPGGSLQPASVAGADHPWSASLAAARRSFVSTPFAIINGTGARRRLLS
jgi:hypothetical protein